MSKKNALGEINLDFEESINTINGIPVTPIKTENKIKPKEVKKKEDNTPSEEDINIEDILNTEQTKSIFEDRKKIYDKEIKSNLESIKTNEEVINKFDSERKKYIEEKEKIKKDNTPSTKKHLKEGYTRHTFAIKDEQLELIRALAEYKGVEQKKLLESLLNKAFENIDEQVKKKALNYLRNKNEDEDLDLFN